MFSSESSGATRTQWFALFLLIASVAAAGCGAKVESTAGQSGAKGVLRLASTTSTRDSGLLDVLLPAFEKQFDCRVDLLAVGTGAALKLGEAGDVDALLCHDQEAEEAFMLEGHGVRREQVMHNYFLVIGPKSDPANAKDASGGESLKRIATRKTRFVSRGDDSGTHKRELSLWEASGGLCHWEDYVESGQGMGATLLMADEMNAYTLVDEGTWLRRRDDLRLVPLSQHSAELKNPYSVIVVDPSKHAAVNSSLASQFADFLTSAETQRRIGDFKVGGELLFHPDRLDSVVSGMEP